MALTHGHGLGQLVVLEQVFVVTAPLQTLDLHLHSLLLLVDAAQKQQTAGMIAVSVSVSVCMCAYAEAKHQQAQKPGIHSITSPYFKHILSGVRCLRYTCAIGIYDQLDLHAINAAI